MPSIGRLTASRGDSYRRRDHPGPGSYPQFERLMTFKTQVANVNDYPAHTGVAYGHTYMLERDSRLANIPIGYSDGYRRIFGQQGEEEITAVELQDIMNEIMVDMYTVWSQTNPKIPR